ncbi:hypothetical protein PVAND_017208 [Polypedilum vanderplanki]|uniref:Uncharacterized protein n=1 Tax=Polypedilum vanderplanki TaxID=319348 RepID=A0A9J6BI22_POLVA|nr:hypothetical protein PVAND_017208 [Polypedilum vanderplanki]
MKCSACENNFCQTKFENRDQCSALKENISCRCKCAITDKQYYVTHGSYITSGLGAAVAGTAISVMSGGILPVIAAAALMGTTIPLTTMPLYKFYKKERMTADETAKDVAVGATMGVVLAPIAVGGNAIANCTSGLAKFSVKTLTSSASGAVGSIVSKGSRLINGEVAKAELIESPKHGAFVGSLGGITGEFANGISSKISSNFGSVITKLGITGVSTAAIDTGIQFAEKGEVDVDQVVASTASQLVVATTAEASAAAAKRTIAYNNKINEQQMKKNNVDPELKKEIKEIIKLANSEEKAIAKGRYVTDKNIHKLYRDREGQFAADGVGSIAENGKRGGFRIIMEKVANKFVYVGHSENHDYKNIKTLSPNESNFFKDFFTQKNIHVELEKIKNGISNVENKKLFEKFSTKIKESLIYKKKKIENNDNESDDKSETLIENEIKSKL